MAGRRSARLGGIVAVVALGLLVLLSGCGNKTQATKKSGPTALGSLATARSALSTTAPDAKLLVVQTATSATSTGTPVWAYLFGDPKTDKTYLVYVTGGQSMGAQLYGTADLSDAEWKQVPSSTDYKYDSDAAYKKALEVSGAKGDPASYNMGLMTYRAPDSTSTVEPLKWNVWLEPGQSGATSDVILVDAKTGKATISKK